MTPAAKREAVAYVQSHYGTSQRWSCGLLNVARGTVRYESRRSSDEKLRKKLVDKAAEHRRWGYRSLRELLEREGMKVNHKRVYRVYADAELQVRCRRRRKASYARGKASAVADGPDQVWAMDFMSDQLADGRRFRLLNVIDVYTRECLAIECACSISGARVARTLDMLMIARDRPAKIIVDNGPEFTGRALDRWAYENHVELAFIQPGKPTQNGFVESFNATCRDRFLNEHWFRTVREAQLLADQWRTIYNTIKPHTALGRSTPEQFAEACRTGCPQT